MYTIRVMTYNIHGCQGADGCVDPSRVLQVISRAGPDVVALQEVGESIDVDQLTWLGSRLAMTPYGPSAAGGNAFLSYYPIQATRSIDMDKGSCLCGDLTISGKRLHLFNIRLHENRRQRQRQLERLLDERDGIGYHSPSCPVLLIGDFADGFLPLRQDLSGSFLRPARRPFWPATFPARFPLWGRDRAYLGGQLRVIDARIYRSALVRRASSHLPLLLTIRIADPRSYLQFKEVKHRRMEIAPG